MPLACRIVICDHIGAINSAKYTLLQQVQSLNSWISTAENIRQAAEEKAKEAYDKLKVNKTLSTKIGEIVKANEKIKDVHGKLDGVHTSLGAWNKEAGKVLQGAIGNAQDVHDALKEDNSKPESIGQNVKNIETAKGQIEQANKALATEVANLGNWRDAAKEVITKADQKCDQILKKVGKKSNNNNDVVIKKEADALKQKAESLLTAYSQAYPKVEGLKKQVEAAISQLETGMKNDLDRLQKDIVSKMKKHVGEMLLQIKGQVESIKGSDTSSWSGETPSGLDGIVAGVQKYAEAFRNNNFAEIAKGWLEATILRYNGTVRRILGKKDAYDEKSEKDDISAFAIGMKEKLNADVIGIAKLAFEGVNTVSGSIHTNINAVKTACEAFANALDKELLQQGNKIVNKVKEEALPLGKLVSKITRCVCECGNCNKPNCGKKAAAELIMCALTSTVRQVGNELESVFLGGGAKVGDGKSIAQELDSVVGLTRTLSDNLQAAEKEARKVPQLPTPDNQDNNEILKKVNEIKTEVNKGMKQDAGHDLNVKAEFESIMKDYKNKRDKGAEAGGLYKQLTEKDIPNAMKPFQDKAGLSGTNEVSSQKQAVNSALEKITDELKAIAWFVDKSKNSKPGDYKGQDDDGIKQHLKKLEDALDKSGLDGAEKGLDAIRLAIHGLQQGTFTDKPAAIEGAVKAIRQQLGELRGKLKDENGAPKDGVIDELEDLKTAGVEGKNGWKVTEGLTKIQEDLKKQNNILPIQTKIIAESLDIVFREMKGVLGQIGMKLDNIFIPDDVMDNLTLLKYKIGMNGSKDSDSLQNIKNIISGLQSGEFTQKPEQIGIANEAIKTALKAQMSTLDNDVIKTLSELMTKGMSNEASWNDDNNAKGLENIISELSNQQGILTKQPEQINQGVNQITKELDDLRSELQGEEGENAEKRGVIKNMEFVIEKIGTNDDDKDCLKKIKKDIEELNRDTVPKVTEHLDKLCEAVQTAGAYAGWHLGQLETPHINEKLEKIKNGIHTLRIDDLQAAIAMCADFLTNADYIKWEKVENIERFVDKEIENAIAELTKQARRDYVESAKDALKHFAAKVAEELGELPGEINRDLFVGFKGFMKYVYGHFDNLESVMEEKEIQALSSAFQNFFAPLDEYLREEIERVKKQSDDEKNPSLPKSEEPYAAEWDAVHSDVNALLNYLCVTQGFDDRLRGLLHNLTDALTQLRPQGFQKPSTPTLDSVSRGLSAFAGEFGGAYISTYSGAECREADADKYAKVLLSFIPMAHNGLTNLAAKCGTNWRGNKICKITGDGRDNGLGNYLTKCGYTVSPTDGLQVGELQNHGDMNGEQIHALLNSPVDVSVKMLIDGKPAENGINVVNLVGLLHNMVCRYLQVCHLKVHESPRYPCTVRDMLSWLSGLQYTPVADKLPDHCRALLNRKCDDNDVPNRDDAVMAQCINGLPYTIAEACSYANSLLVTIQGRGRGFDLAAYPYSVDFANNTAQLYYPADPDELLEMMRRIICRLCSVLYFLYSQCCRATAETKGWRECHYGRRVPYSHWQCNTYDNQATDASHNCPPTSPLQSFLTDSCPNLLPHKLSVVDNAIECADCPANLPGQQCLTPLGFWDLGLAASVERTGRELAKSLGYLCSDADACLFQLCRTLCLLCPAAPQSLGDVFALFFQMLRVWDHESSRRAYSHHESYLTHLNGDAINGLFPLWKQLHCSYQNSNLTEALKALAGHDHNNSGHNALSSLSAEPPCQSPSGCAPFLQSLSLHANHTFPQKHAQLYVSWIVWLAWQLWELLESLLDALNNIDCTAHGCATCLCQPSNHNDKDSCHCPSLVECGGPLPTLYRYGFTYRNAHVLLAGSQKIRCSDLNDQLTKALHSDHFTQLFHQIDQLLYTIRAPFLFCLAALWLTATLYILVMLLYRMDVLRIRSHLLTTRASHLIDVKALLAGSRRMLSLHKDWIEAADAAVKAAKEKAEDVHGRLDHNKKDQHDGTVIGQNIEKIKQAKDKVSQVDDQLKCIHTDLGNWKDAAHSVLGTAVGKATEVHGRLKPDGKDPKHILGQNIKEIGERNKEIQTANSTLGREVAALGNWIDSAEKIREKAQKMAQEAHDRLREFHEGTKTKTTLTENIDKIVEAKNKIIGVNKNIGSRVNQLDQWRDAAETLLNGVISDAGKVKDKLSPDDKSRPLSEQINKISEAKDAIVKADKQLENHLGSLSDWKREAESVLVGAIKKAENVWKALDETKKEDKSLGKNIENIETAKKAIENANQSLGEEVGHLNNWHTAADKIVAAGKVKCEKILERVIKDGKTEGTQIGINAQALQKKAENLLDAYSTAHKNVKALESAVPNAIKDLEAGMKEDLERLQRDIVQKMREHVGGMLGEIQKSVESIKGKAGNIAPNSQWEHSNIGSGLAGISTKVQKYFEAFNGQWPFDRIVGGWIDDILQHNGVVKRLLGWDRNREEDIKKELHDSGIGGSIKSPLDEQIKAAVAVFKYTQSTATDGIESKISQVKQACELFARTLDEEKLEKDFKTGVLAMAKQAKDAMVEVDDKEPSKQSHLKGIIQKAKCTCSYGNCSSGNCLECTDQKCILTQAVATTLLAVSSVGRQVGKELQSVFLSPDDANIASFLDAAKAATDKLHENLGEAAQAATKPGPQPPTSSSQGPNNILQSVQGIERKVKEGMKDNSRDGNINVNEVMTSYKEKKDKAATNSDGKYQMLLADIPQAMEPFTTEAKLKDPKELSSQKQAVNSALEKITSELQAIAWFVDKSKNSKPGDYTGTDMDGIKDHLANLKNALDQKGFDGVEKGLDAIRLAINTLQQQQFTTQPKAIGSAVQAIRQQLGELRGKLKKDGDKSGVIDALDDLKEKGLEGKDPWSVNGQSLSGLGKIQEDLKKQNETLGKQPEIITNAISAIRDQLFQIGIKLNKPFDYDDVLDKLIQLQRKLGTADAQNYGVNLKKIYDEIHWQQISTFTHKPYEIQAANEAIKVALNEQMDTLDKEVIEKLTNLMTTGLSDQASWQPSGQKNAKGFDHIISDLSNQQDTLTKQHPAIGSGVQKITSELDELRKQLQGKDGDLAENRGVIKNMEFLIGKIGKQDDDPNSLKKIKKEIDTLNKQTVPKVSEHLDKLCAKIRLQARDAKFFLKELEEVSVDEKLKGIKDDIHTLRIDDLQAAIAMCADFLTNADYIKWEKVENIERFVDKEIENAIAELTKQARRDYVESAKDALKHFAAKVAEELGELPGEINRDLFVGFKGFMKYVYGHFDNLESVMEEKEIQALSSAFQNFFAPLDEYLREEIERVKKQSDDEKNPSLPKSEEPYAAEWDAVHSDVNALLNYLCVTQGFDDRLRGLLHNLTDALTQLRPQGFQKPSTPTLDSVSRGLSAFAGEFGGAYISTYSGAECREADADKYAKVLLSFIPMAHNAHQPGCQMRHQLARQ
ncbi:Extracellular matrix-binding ebh [Babesia ovata]|uniref:Extracellular matrix-binding ebh n=1 Tax=Babesia ovata TaxID=189622 RepID=A0A2H6KJU8_9APIC|nr:Extracellular matrix-binding ebh [Babesia ovata]GBE63258.1 Extracellular matrix-binding ebh [Babesia ovata]